LNNVTLDVVEFALAIAAKAEGAAEVPPGSNAGPYVERILKPCGLGAGYPWCCADAVDTIAILSRALGVKCPLPLTAGCQAMADFLEAHHALFTEPARGDFWICWHAELKPARFGHIGLVRSIPDPAHVIVQAGNTIRPGATGDTREGWVNWTRTEPVGPKDRFGRWSLLFAALAPAPVPG
jgi:hypothetical protein